MSLHRAEKAYEKHAWIIFLIIGLFFLVVAGIIRALVASPADDDVRAITGMGWDEIAASTPGQARLVTHFLTAGALSAVFWAIFVVTVAAFPYKRGEKWSWYLFWSLPLQFAILAAFFFSELGHTTILAFYSFWIFLSLLGLFLPYRKFFPKASVTA